MYSNRILWASLMLLFLPIVVPAWMVKAGPVAVARSVPGPMVELSVEKAGLILTDDLAVAQKQVAHNPENPEAYFLLSVAYSRTPYLEKAYQAMKRAKSLVKKHPERYAYMDRVMREYQDTLAVTPDDPLLTYRIAMGYLAKGYGVEEGYIRNADGTPETYYQRAIDYLERHIDRHPDDPWAMNYLGYLLITMDETRHLDRAIGLWERSLSVAPDNAGAYILLGEAYLKKKQLQKALQYGAKGLEARMKWEQSQNRADASTTP